jgi:doublecortin-like kinase 1/2
LFVFICRSFDSLIEDLTKQLGERLNGAIRCIYSVEGKKIEKLDDFEDHSSYVCSCNNENFKKMEYSSNSVIKAAAARVSKNGRPSSPMKNGTNSNGASTVSTKDETSVVFPRIVTLIRNGVKPRKVLRMLLNKRNSPTFEHILQAITQVIKLDSGCVRKVFKLDGTPVTRLADFFDANDDVFFAYGNERVGNDDFELESDESKDIRQSKKTLKNGAVRNGPKPKMPVKSHNDTFAVCVDEELLNGGIRSESLPSEIQKRFQR